ncbi:hypothetical protein N7494_003950 [Penicillium frequentans]|uniref:Uncharacterized protein n=1 Tax=Penicillium frequentans TaxID=3151616 RepID=A0AAD6CZN4_9EURO|nr:hypothetical protein N7494_003950 [Penicillium glabrum]
MLDPFTAEEMPRVPLQTLTSTITYKRKGAQLTTTQKSRMGKGAKPNLQKPMLKKLGMRFLTIWKR